MKELPYTLAIVLLLSTTLMAQGKEGSEIVNRQDNTAQLEKLLDELTVLAGRPQRSIPEWTRGTYVATRFYSTGRPGVPRMLSRFQGARIYEEAMLAGLYVSIHGSEKELKLMRQELESNRVKRYWLQQHLGTTATLTYSVEDGKEWKPFSNVLPATDGCKRLADLCMESHDPLVRRFGMYAGFWFPSPHYWSQIKETKTQDTDALNRGFAIYLQASAAGNQ